MNVSVGVASELIVDVPGKAIVHPVYTLTSPGFSTGGSVNVTATLGNKASNFYDLANGVKITSGSATAATFPGQLVLAGSSVTGTWSGLPFSGPARATLFVNGKPVAYATTLVIPIWQLGGPVAILLAIILV